MDECSNDVDAVLADIVDSPEVLDDEVVDPFEEPSLDILLFNKDNQTSLYNGEESRLDFLPLLRWKLPQPGEVLQDEVDLLQAQFLILSNAD